jgi:hypothetical protein
MIASARTRPAPGESQPAHGPQPTRERTAPPEDEFYIGYEGGMAPGIGRRVRAALMTGACAASICAAIVLFAPTRLPVSTFEFGMSTEMSGVLRRMPHPVLDVNGRRVWLVGPGKSGAEAALSGVADGPVRLRGSRIQRGRHEMLEVREAIRSDDPGGHSAAEPPRSPDLRITDARAQQVALRGEIVDSKCFLGVMNPADGAVHRDCARRCLSGGLPPMLLVRDGRHGEELVLLLSADGRPSGADLANIAGVSVEVSGRLRRDGDGYVLLVSKWRKLAGSRRAID